MSLFSRTKQIEEPRKMTTQADMERKKERWEEAKQDEFNKRLITALQEANPYDPYTMVMQSRFNAKYETRYKIWTALKSKVDSMKPERKTYTCSKCGCLIDLEAVKYGKSVIRTDSAGTEYIHKPIYCKQHAPKGRVDEKT